MLSSKRQTVKLEPNSCPQTPTATPPWRTLGVEGGERERREEGQEEGQEGRCLLRTKIRLVQKVRDDHNHMVAAFLFGLRRGRRKRAL